MKCRYSKLEILQGTLVALRDVGEAPAASAVDNKHSSFISSFDPYSSTRKPLLSLFVQREKLRLRLVV